MNAKKEKIKISQKRKPDIAFWFEKKTDRYLIEIKEDIVQSDILAASFDLLVRAIKIDFENDPEIEYNKDAEE